MDANFVAGLARRATNKAAAIPTFQKPSIRTIIDEIYAEYIRRLRITGEAEPAEFILRYQQLEKYYLSGKEIQNRVIQELLHILTLKNDARSELCTRLDGYGLRHRVILDRIQALCKKLIDDGLKILKGE